MFCHMRNNKTLDVVVTEENRSDRFISGIAFDVLSGIVLGILCCVAFGIASGLAAYAIPSMWHIWQKVSSESPVLTAAQVVALFCLWSA